jgi:hypothetical protein
MYLACDMLVVVVVVVVFLFVVVPYCTYLQTIL